MKIKKIVSYVLIFALVLGIFPLGNSVEAQGFDIPPVTDSEGNTTFSYQGDDSVTKVTLAGSMNGWVNNDETTLFTEGEDNLFTLTLDVNRLPAGDYEFKYIVDGKWMPDPGDNLKYTVPAPTNYHKVTPVTDEEGNTTFTFYGDENTNNVYLAGSMNDWSPNNDQYLFTKEGNKFTLILTSEQMGPGDYEYKYVADGKWIPDLADNLKYTVPGTEEPTDPTDPSEPVQTYTYTINYKRTGGDHMDWDMWIFGAGLDGNAYGFTEEVDGYARGTHTFELNEITVITRPKEWSTQEGNRVITIPEGQTSVEVWINQDDETVYYTKPGGDTPAPVRRSVSFYYDRPENDYDGWGVWTWSTGLSDTQNDFDENGFTKAIISNNATNVGFKVNKDSWSEIDQDFDRTVATDPNALERTTKVYLTQGQAEFFQVPYVTGPEINSGNITFYYRDLDLYESDNFDQLTDVKINIKKVDLETGESTNVGSFDMTKDEKNQYFAYTLENADQGYKYVYTFSPTKNGQTEENINDIFNTVDGESYIEYKSSNITIEATTELASVEAGDSIVIDVKVNNPDNATIKEIYIDGSNLGNDSKIKVEPGLLSQAVEVGYYLEPGIKEVKVVLVDEYDNQSIEKLNIETLANSDTGATVDWDEEIIYFMLTDRFADGDASNNPAGYDPNHLEAYHGGDFQGIIDNVDYLKNLGITTVWITPIVDNIDINLRESVNSKQYGYHGYWAENFEKIEASLGSEEKLKELIDVLNDNGIKLMVDVVLNHSGYETKNSGVFEGMHRDVSGGTDQTMELAGLPDFLTENPDVSKLLVEWQSSWLNKLRTDKGNAIDYFRIDTVKHVEHETWKEFKNALVNIDPDFKMIGEQYGASIDSTGGYLGNGMMDSLLDFEFKNLADNFLKGNIASVEERLAYRNSKMDPNKLMGQFLSSHDEDGFLIARLNGNEDLMKVAASLQLTAKGQPVIYYGEEIGMSGLNANFDQGRYGENRRSFDWDNIENNKMLAHYTTMINIRREFSEVFARGERNTLFTDDQASVFTRTYNGKTVIVALNITDQEKEVTFDIENIDGNMLYDLYSNSLKFNLDGSKATITIPANSDGGTLVLVPAEDEEPIDDPVTPEDPSDDESDQDEDPGDIDKEDDQETGKKPGKRPTDNKPNKPSDKSPRTSDKGVTNFVLLAALAGLTIMLTRKKEEIN